jgi:hypothetical protein
LPGVDANFPLRIQRAYIAIWGVLQAKPRFKCSVIMEDSWMTALFTKSLIDLLFSQDESLAVIVKGSFDDCL